MAFRDKNAVIKMKVQNITCLLERVSAFFLDILNVNGHVGHVDLRCEILLLPLVFLLKFFMLFVCFVIFHGEEKVHCNLRFFISQMT